MSHAINEISQMADRHAGYATEIARTLSYFSEIGALLEKYGQAENV
jgi:hypothetical protein